MEYPNALFLFLFYNDTQLFALFQFETCYCIWIKSLEFFVQIGILFCYLSSLRSGFY